MQQQLIPSDSCKGRISLSQILELTHKREPIFFKMPRFDSFFGISVLDLVNGVNFFSSYLVARNCELHASLAVACGIFYQNGSFFGCVSIELIHNQRPVFVIEKLLSHFLAFVKILTASSCGVLDPSDPLLSSVIIIGECGFQIPFFFHNQPPGHGINLFRPVIEKTGPGRVCQQIGFGKTKPCSQHEHQRKEKSPPLSHCTSLPISFLLSFNPLLRIGLDQNLTST